MVRTGTYERSLVEAQHQRGVGIFACDSFSVFADSAMLLGEVKADLIYAVASAVGNRARIGETTNSWLNVETFLQVWERVLANDDFKRRDWTVKVDPDTVFFPERLTPRLAARTPVGGDGLFFMNCDQYGEDFFGAIEVLSREAVEHYGKNKVFCYAELEWQGWGEDYYIRTCLDQTGVPHERDFGLLADYGGHCNLEAPLQCSNPADYPVAFHPMKSEGSFLACLEEVRNLAAPLAV